MRPEIYQSRVGLPAIARLTERLDVTDGIRPTDAHRHDVVCAELDLWLSPSTPQAAMVKVILQLSPLCCCEASAIDSLSRRVVHPIDGESVQVVALVGGLTGSDRLTVLGVVLGLVGKLRILRSCVVRSRIRDGSFSGARVRSLLTSVLKTLRSVLRVRRSTASPVPLSRHCQHFGSRDRGRTPALAGAVASSPIGASHESLAAMTADSRNRGTLLRHRDYPSVSPRAVAAVPGLCCVNFTRFAAA